jgi:hypothetical protein
VCDKTGIAGLNTFHLQEFKDKEDKKAKQAEKKGSQNS